MVRKSLQEWGLLGVVVLMGIGANLPKELTATWGFDRRYLLGGLIALVAISLVRYLKFTLILAVVILTAGANLPLAMAEELHVSNDIMLFALVAMVIVSLVNRVFNYLPTGLEPSRASGTRHGTVALLQAVARGQTSLVQRLLKKDLNLNARTSIGQTPLMVAAAKGYADLVMVLLDGDADVNATDNEGKTALELAIDGGHTRTAEILKAAGASHPDSTTWDALALATAPSY